MQWIFQETSDPGLPPETEGQWWINQTTKRAWLSVGVDTVDDWMEFVPAFGSNFGIINNELHLLIGGAYYKFTGRVTDEGVVEQGISQTPTAYP